MKIQFDAQLLLDEQKTGISWTAQKLIEGMVKSGRQNDYTLNYFALFQLLKKRKFVSKLIELGCSSNECRWFHYSLYKLIYNLVPVPYSLFFGNKADITHFMNYHIPPGVKGKTVTMVYDMVYKVFPETMNTKTRFMLYLSMKRTCRRADIIITVSQFSKNEIMKYLNVPPEKIVVMPCGVDTALYKPDYSMEDVQKVKSKYNIKQDYILYLGTLEPRKNIGRLIDAYSLLKQRIPASPVLVIAGRKGWQYDSIFEKVNTLGLNDRVIFTGYVDAADTPVLIKGAAFFVFPSIYEGFGLPPLEAMACGTPVITSNAASLPEVVGDAALMADPFSFEAIASAMELMILDGNLRSELSRKGLERASRFTWDNSVKIILDVYSRLS